MFQEDGSRNNTGFNFSNMIQSPGSDAGALLLSLQQLLLSTHAPP